MAYSGDPAASGIDAVRFWVQDTAKPELLTDDEIDYLIVWSKLDPDQYPIDIAALAAERIAAKYAGRSTITADGVSYSGGELQTKFNQLAVALRKQATRTAGGAGAPFIGGLSIGRMFAVGMDDNPEGYEQRHRGPSEDQRLWNDLDRSGRD